MRQVERSADSRDRANGSRVYRRDCSNVNLSQLLPMAYRDLLAPRSNGSIARIRVYDDFVPPLAVDTDRAFAASKALGAYNPSYHWSTKFFTSLASIILVGGFVSLFWWPWWVPIVGFVVSRIVFKAAKQSCADFVRDILRDDPTQSDRMAQLGLLLSEIPASAVPTR